MLELFRAGGPVMYPLLLCSFLTVAVIFERSLFWWRIARGRDNVVERVLAVADQSSGAKAAGQMHTAAQREVVSFGRYLGILNTLVSLAPLLGIFGTVLGIMESFQFLDSVGGGAPEAAKQGLARALLTTAFGLAVAMVSLIALKLFQAQVARLRHELEMRCSEKEIALGLVPWPGAGG